MKSNEIDSSKKTEGNRWSEQSEIGIVSREEIENLIKRLFEIDEIKKEERNNLDITVQFLESALRPQNAEARAHRASVCHALNKQRSIKTRIKGSDVFDSLGYVLRALLDGCTKVNSDVANAKMCMMLSETFYIEDYNIERNSTSSSSPSRLGRLCVKSMLIGYERWNDDGFWEEGKSASKFLLVDS